MNYVDQLLSMNYPITNPQAGANITNLLGTLYTNQMNWQQNQAAMAHADRAAAEADQRTRQLFKDLYSPAARVQQLKDAGLSVGLMYGQGGMGGSGAAGTQAQTPAQIPMQAPHAEPDYDHLNIISMALDNAMKIAQMKNINADTANKQENLPILKQTAELVKEQTENAKLEREKLNAEVSKITEEKILIKEQQKDTKAAAELKQAQKEFQETQKKIADIQLKYEDDLKYWEVNAMQENYEKLFQEARKLGIEADKMEEYMNEQMKLMAAQALQAKANASKSYKEKELINEQIQQIKRSNDIEKELDEIFGTNPGDDSNGKGGAMRKILRTIYKLYQDYKHSQILESR